MSPAGALILGGDYRALGIARSLGRQGIPVWVVQDDDRLAGTSRFVRRRLPWPAPDEVARIAFLQALAHEHDLDGWVLFPTTDEAAAMVSRAHDKLSVPFRLTTSPWPVHHAATNKTDLYLRAGALSIAHPRTFQPQGEKDLPSLDLTFPMILKPSQRRARNEFTAAKAWRVDTAEQLLDRYRHACSLVDPADVMIQELIPGDGECQVSFACVCVEGTPIAWLTATRIRQFPMDFGRLSTFVVTQDHPSLLEPSRRLLADLRLTGPVEVEFKYDARDQSMKLLDVNARMWGWHSLGAAAGVDFSHLAWLAAQGRAVPDTSARAGVRWVRLSTDFPTAVGEIRARRLRIGQYLRSVRPPLEGPIAALSDPLPVLAELPLIALNLLRRRWNSSR